MKVRPGPELAGRAYMNRFGCARAQSSSDVRRIRRRADPVRQVFEQRAGRVVVHHHAVALALRPVQRQRGRFVDRREVGQPAGVVGQQPLPQPAPRARRRARRCRSAPGRCRPGRRSAAPAAWRPAPGPAPWCSVSRDTASGCAARNASKAGCISASAPPTSRIVIGHRRRPRAAGASDGARCRQRRPPCQSHHAGLLPQRRCRPAGRRARRPTRSR